MLYSKVALPKPRIHIQLNGNEPLLLSQVQGRPQKTQSNVILESHIICCTLSTSGGLLLESAFRGQGGVPFSCVIVDEVSERAAVQLGLVLCGLLDGQGLRRWRHSGLRVGFYLPLRSLSR